MSDETGSGKSNMAASKPEVRVSQLVRCTHDRNEISTAVARCIQVQLSNGIGCDADRPNQKWEI